MAAENEMCHKLPPPIILLLSHMSPNLFPHRQGKEINKICAGVIRRKKKIFLMTGILENVECREDLNEAHSHRIKFKRTVPVIC